MSVFTFELWYTCGHSICCSVTELCFILFSRETADMWLGEGWLRYERQQYECEDNHAADREPR